MLNRKPQESRRPWAWLIFDVRRSMRCLTKVEIRAWYARHGLPPDPYDGDSGRLQFYLQFHAPKRFRPVEAFVRDVAAVARDDDEYLVSVIDAVMPWDFELRMFDRLRLSGDSSLLDAPGHLFTRDEVGDMVAMFSLTVALEWKVYLHIPQIRSILYNWEGEIFDFWSSDRRAFEAVSAMLPRFKLDQTKTPNKAPEPTPTSVMPRANERRIE